MVVESRRRNTTSTGGPGHRGMRPDTDEMLVLTLLQQLMLGRDLIAEKNTARVQGKQRFRDEFAHAGASGMGAGACDRDRDAGSGSATATGRGRAVGLAAVSAAGLVLGVASMGVAAPVMGAASGDARGRLRRPLPPAPGPQ